MDLITHKILNSIKKFDNNNIFNYNFVLLIKPNSEFSDKVLELREKYNDLIKIPQSYFYPPHITLIYGVKFNNINNLFNFLKYISKISSNMKKINVKNSKFLSYNDPKSIVLRMDDKSDDRLKQFRINILKKDYLFSEVLPYSYLIYLYNRYQAKKDHKPYKSHIGLLYFYNFKNSFMNIDSVYDEDYLIDFSKLFLEKEILNLKLSTVSLVYCTNNNSKWNDLIDFDLID